MRTLRIPLLFAALLLLISTACSREQVSPLAGTYECEEAFCDIQVKESITQVNSRPDNKGKNVPLDWFAKAAGERFALELEHMVHSISISGRDKASLTLRLPESDHLLTLQGSYISEGRDRITIRIPESKETKPIRYAYALALGQGITFEVERLAKGKIRLVYPRTLALGLISSFLNDPSIVEKIVDGGKGSADDDDERKGRMGNGEQTLGGWKGVMVPLQSVSQLIIEQAESIHMGYLLEPK